MYCTPEDVREIIPLVDDATMPDEDVAKIIARASAYIDSRLGSIYPVPFDPVPDAIKSIAADYAAYLILRVVYYQNSPNTSDATHELKKDAEEAIERLVSGEMVLPAPTLDYEEIHVKKKVFTIRDITPDYGDHS